MQQPVIDGSARASIFGGGLGGIIAVIVLLTGAPAVVNALLIPTTAALGFFLGGVYDGYIRKPTVPPG